MLAVLVQIPFGDLRVLAAKAAGIKLLQEIIVSAEKEFECLKPKKDDAKPKKDGDILSFCW